jgi:integrase
MTGHVRKRGKSYTIVIELGTDSPGGTTGKRPQKYIPGFRTKRAAEEEKIRILAEMNSGSWIEPSALTVGDYLQRWLEDHAKSRVRPKTWDTYEMFVRVHLKPALGLVRLAKLSPLHVERFLASALEGGRRDGREGGLSPRTVKHLYALLHAALERAVRWRLVATNPVAAVDPPRVETAERPVLSEAHADVLLQGVEGGPFYVPILLAVLTGMRRGEILGLHWEDVDLEAGRLQVAHSLGQVSARTRPEGDLVFVQGPKTSKKRLVTLGPLLIMELRRHRGQQAQRRLDLGPEYHHEGLVCPREDGRPATPNIFSRDFGRLVGKLGIPDVTFHDLRHTNVTLLIAKKIHTKIISERVGHSSSSVTMDLYGHLLSDGQDEAAALIERELLRDRDLHRPGALPPGA